MILKKPYGLMIKHFRLIHFVLTLLTVFAMYLGKNVVTFFQNFVSSGYKATIIGDMASTYISFLVYFVLIFIIIISISLVVLLHYKEKPYKFYLYTSMYYIALFIFTIVAATLLNGLQSSLWSTSMARIYRDLALIIYFPQIIVIIFLIIRTLGFDIKKFDFKTDIAEMQSSEEDSEEIEIQLGFETYKVKRTARRFLREMGYYVKENIIIVISIAAVVVFIIGYLFIKNYEVYTSKYSQGSSFRYEAFNLKVDDSIITNLNYNGETIKNNNYYLVLKITFTNNTVNSLKLDYSNLLVFRGKKYYEPDLSVGNYFVDYGEPYYGKEIAPNSTKTYLLTYKIDEKDINKKYKLILYTGASLKKEGFKAKTSVVKLSPIVLNTVNTVNTVDMNTTLSFDSTYLDSTTLNIKNYDITKKYIYQYDSCINSICNKYYDSIVPSIKEQTDSTLLVLDYDYKLDKSSTYAAQYHSVSSFANQFLTVKYILNKEEYYAKVTCLNKANLKDKIVLQTTADISKADLLYLVVTIRNNRYLINLKR